MGYGLRVGKCTICLPNPQSRTTQTLFFVPVKKTKAGEGVKNGHFLPIFELIYYSNGERPGAPTYRVVRALLRHYTYHIVSLPHTPAITSLVFEIDKKY